MDESEWSMPASLHGCNLEVAVLNHTIEKVQQKQQQSERVGSQHQVKTPNFRIYMWVWCQYFSCYCQEKSRPTVSEVWRVIQVLESGLVKQNGSPIPAEEDFCVTRASPSVLK